MKFVEFNNAININDTAYYSVNSSGGVVVDKATFQEIVPILKTINDAEIYLKLPQKLMIIETTNKLVIDTIIALDEEVFVVKINNVYQIYSFNNLNKNTKNNMLACGCNANTVVGKEILLPFRSANNKSKVFDSISVVYDKGIGNTPLWLMPQRNASSKYEDGLTLPLKENKLKLLKQHITALNVDTDNKIKMIRFMNEYFIEPSLTEHEINTLIEDLQDKDLSEFFDKKEFLHDKFGDYVINQCNIKKDKKSKDLYFYNKRRNIYTSDEDFLRGYITKMCPRLKKYQKDEAICYINDILEYDAVDFNSNEFNVVFQNGILHLDEWKFEPMSPEHLESVQIAANWNPDATSETVDEFFRNATCNDKECEMLLYESIGYSMLKTSELAKMFVLVGGGRNGKSTYLDLVKAVLGKENCTSLAPKDLQSNFRTAMLKGKLASLCGDISAQPIKDNDLLKQIISGDDITIERKYKDATSDSVFATMFYACNSIPRTNDSSYGNARRWVIVPFKADLTNVTNVDGFAFKKKLLSQDSIDYVAYKSVKAIYDVLNTTKEFTNPQAAQDALKDYLIRCSSVLSWFYEVFGGNLQTLQIKINENGAFTNYKSWCEENNRSPKSATEWREELKSQFKDLKFN